MTSDPIRQLAAVHPPETDMPAVQVDQPPASRDAPPVLSPLAKWIEHNSSQCLKGSQIMWVNHCRVWKLSLARRDFTWS